MKSAFFPLLLAGLVASTAFAEEHVKTSVDYADANSPVSVIQSLESQPSNSLVFSSKSAISNNVLLESVGGQDAGGGDAYEAEFKQIGLNLVLDVLTYPASEIPFSPQLLKFAVDTVRIQSVDKVLILDGKKRMAINFLKAKLVLLSSPSWRLLNDTQKNLLVLHEYLRFVKVDDSKYAVSTKALRILQKAKGDATKELPIEMIANQRYEIGGDILGSDGLKRLFQDGQVVGAVKLGGWGGGGITRDMGMVLHWADDTLTKVNFNCGSTKQCHFSNLTMITATDEDRAEIHFYRSGDSMMIQASILPLRHVDSLKVTMTALSKRPPYAGDKREWFDFKAYLPYSRAEKGSGKMVISCYNKAMGLDIAWGPNGIYTFYILDFTTRENCETARRALKSGRASLTMSLHPSLEVFTYTP